MENTHATSITHPDHFDFCYDEQSHTYRPSYTIYLTIVKVKLSHVR